MITSTKGVGKSAPAVTNAKKPGMVNPLMKKADAKAMKGNCPKNCDCDTSKKPVVECSTTMAKKSESAEQPINKIAEEQMVNPMDAKSAPAPIPTDIPTTDTNNTVAPTAPSAPMTAPVAEPMAVTTPAAPDPTNPLTPPVEGMIPTGWAFPSQLAAAVAMDTGDVNAAATAPDVSRPVATDTSGQAVSVSSAPINVDNMLSDEDKAVLNEYKQWKAKKIEESESDKDKEIEADEKEAENDKKESKEEESDDDEKSKKDDSEKDDDDASEESDESLEDEDADGAAEAIDPVTLDDSSISYSGNINPTDFLNDDDVSNSELDNVIGSLFNAKDSVSDALDTLTSGNSDDSNHDMSDMTDNNDYSFEDSENSSEDSQDYTPFKEKSFMRSKKIQEGASNVRFRKPVFKNVDVRNRMTESVDDVSMQGIKWPVGSDVVDRNIARFQPSREAPASTVGMNGATVAESYEEDPVYRRCCERASFYKQSCRQSIKESKGGMLDLKAFRKYRKFEKLAQKRKKYIMHEAEDLNADDKIATTADSSALSKSIGYATTEDIVDKVKDNDFQEALNSSYNDKKVIQESGSSWTNNNFLKKYQERSSLNFKEMLHNGLLG